MNEDLWWTKEGDELAEKLMAAATSLADEDRDRLQCLRAYECIYKDVNPPSSDVFKAVGYKRDNPSRMPVLQSMVDSTLSRIGRARPLPSILTSDGDWKQKRKARKLTRWLAGMFKKLNVHSKMHEGLRNALVHGTGCPKVLYDEAEDELCVELVPARDLFVERLEAERNCVRTLYQMMAVDRGTLIDQYPDFEKEIKAADRWEDDKNKPGHTDLVLVVEAWRIGTKQKPGKRVIAVDGAVLVEEEWKKKRFPFAFLPWRKVPGEFWGHGMVEGGRGLQSMINYVSSVMERCFRYTFPFILYDKNSGFQAEALSNTEMTAYPVDGLPSNAVMVVQPPPFGPGHQEYLQSLTSKLHETQGVSELAASSHKPAGLNSGKALLVFQDVESERFLTQGRAFEQAHIEIAELIIDFAEDIYKTKSKSAALKTLGGKRALEAIEFKDVRFGDHPWEVQVYPITSLSQSPSGRLEQIEMLIGLGAITEPAVVRELLDYPDLERYRSVESAQRDLAEKLIDQCLDKGEVTPANPYMDLPYTRKRAELELNLAEIEGAPEDRKQALRDFIGSIDSVADQLAKAEQQAAQAQAAAAGPMGAPAGPMGAGPMGGPAGLVPPEGPEIADVGAMPGV